MSDTPTRPVRENSQAVYRELRSISDAVTELNGCLGVALEDRAYHSAQPREVWHRCFDLRKRWFCLLDAGAVADQHMEGSLTGIDDLTDLSRELIDAFEAWSVGRLARECSV